MEHPINNQSYNIYFFPAITCHKPDRPNNGILKCPRAISFGSRCIVKCLAGYKRQGSRVITCMKTSNESTQGFWKPDKPISCMYYKESSCKETMQEPKHGSVVCENSEQFMKSKKSNHIGTICAFTCDSGYYIHGQSTSKCLDGGQWTSAVPTCVRGMCQEPVQDSHRIESCTDKYGIGSVCTLSCETGYKLIGNASSITCVSVSDDVQRGKWSNEFSKCEISECRPKLQNPSNGRVECTNKNIEGSVCTFSCERGYDLSGTDGKTLETECRNDGDSTSWTVAAPTCQVRRCPRLEKPENGDVLCQNGRIVGSKCTFTCNMGFDLAESSTPSMETICRKNISGGSVGSWTVQTVTCEPIVCEPEPQNPVNGVVTCSKGNSLGSICTYSCVFLYDLDGTTEKYITTQCKDGDGGDGKGIWFGEPGTCYKKIACGTQQKEPENGSVKCSDGNYMFSECEFACKEGYVMKGVPHTYCVDLKNDGDAVAEWTNPAPKCEIGICLPKWYDERTMIESCSNTKVDGGYPVGTNCQYSCKDKGFFLQFGVDVNLENGITCLPSKEWSELSHPRCSRSACDPLAEIPFGYFICSNGFNYGTECQFQCENKYTPSISEPLTCQEDSSNPKRGSWDKESPKCMLNECAKIPSNPKMGLITCTNQLKVGSKCTLKCEPGYAPIMKEIRCKTGNGDSVPTFGPMDKFCCAECKNDMEVVQIVDARFSSNLKKVTEFTKTMINALAVESSDIGFSSFIYNDEVFTDSMIQRTELSITGTSISNIIEHISGWKLMSEGKGKLCVHPENVHI